MVARVRGWPLRSQSGAQVTMWNQVNSNKVAKKLLTEYRQADREDLSEPTSVLITNEEAEEIEAYGIGTGQVNLTHGRVGWSLTGFAGGTPPHIRYKEVK